MRPDPFLPPYNVRFRRGAPTNLPPDAPHNAILGSDVECQASESAFISWDFWKYGFGRIMVVPGVHATYGKDDARIRGWLEFPNPEEPDWPEQVEWDDECVKRQRATEPCAHVRRPPRKIRCHDWPDKPGKGWWAWDTGERPTFYAPFTLVTASFRRTFLRTLEFMIARSHISITYIFSVPSRFRALSLRSHPLASR
jgi:hypothetical protein